MWFAVYDQTQAGNAICFNSLQFCYGRAHGIYGQTHGFYDEAHGLMPPVLCSKPFRNNSLAYARHDAPGWYMEWYMVGILLTNESAASGSRVLDNKLFGNPCALA
jgi:hypothetical protein